MMVYNILKWVVLGIWSLLGLITILFYFWLVFDLKTLQYPLTAIFPVIEFAILNTGLGLTCVYLFRAAKGKHNKAMLICGLGLIAITAILFPIGRAVNVSISTTRNQLSNATLVDYLETDFSDYTINDFMGNDLYTQESYDDTYINFSQNASLYGHHANVTYTFNTAETDALRWIDIEFEESEDLTDLYKSIVNDLIAVSEFEYRYGTTLYSSDRERKAELSGPLEGLERKPTYEGPTNIIESHYKIEKCENYASLDLYQTHNSMSVSVLILGF
ncbi:MAG: hypothetical protein U0M23_06550 [Acutalibacteraceae bacterium]|nr:hypothetical protein [Acutalibacteraceae bacterium]